ncbi:unnamed protein product [Lymnaea stagnalis]|uniref:Uncharacterized protein n=1 Tax=Lymnaea stagnalis TaxID=6523 RepID=A0AAV2H2R7_LYMST
MNSFSIYPVTENKQLFSNSIPQTKHMNIFEDLSYSIGVGRWSFDGDVSSHGREHFKSQDYSTRLNCPLLSTRYPDKDATDDSSETRSHSLTPPNSAINTMTDRTGNFLQIKNVAQTCQEEIANAPFDDHFVTQRSHVPENTTAKIVFDNKDNAHHCQDFSRRNGVTPHCEMMPATESFPAPSNWSYPPNTTLYQHQMYSNIPVSSPTQNYYTSNQYGSFINELCSPDLQSAEDAGIHYELPLSFGLEDCGFDNFLQPIPLETSSDISNDALVQNEENFFQKKSTNAQPSCIDALLFEDVHPPSSFNSEENVGCFPIREESRISTETNCSPAKPFIHQAAPRNESPRINHNSHHQTSHVICGSSQNSSQDPTPNTREINPTSVTLPDTDHQPCARWQQGSPSFSSWQAKPFCRPAQGNCHDFESVLSGAGPEIELFRSYNFSTPHWDNTFQTDGKYTAVDPDLRLTCTSNPLLANIESDVVNNRGQSNNCTGQSNPCTGQYNQCTGQSNPCTGHRALLTFMLGHATSNQDGMKNISNHVISSAMDHIMQNRPQSNLFPTAREILDNCFKQTTRLLQETIGDKCEKLLDDATDKENNGESPPKRKRATDVPSEETLPGQRSVSVSSMSVGSPPSHESVGCHSDPSPNTSPSDSRYSSLSSSDSSKTEIRRPSVLPPCRVCTSKASGLHYGVVTCEACNGFFRRSLKRGAIYLCSKNRQCDVKGKKRGECSYCRYQTCLAVGMSKTAVKTGRYSDKTRLAYAIETDNQNKNNHSPVEDSPRLDPMASDLIKLHRQHAERPGQVLDHEPLERQCKYSELYSSPAHSIDRVTRITTHHKDVLGVPGLRTPADTSEAGFSKIMAGFLENWMLHFVKFVKRIPGFNLLHLNDQTSLVRSTWHEIWLLGAHRGFNSEIKVTSNPYVASSPNGTTSPNGTSSPKGTVLHYDEIKMVFGQVYADVSFKLSNQLKKLKVTPDEIVLIQMMCLTYPEGHRLENPDQVRSLHWLMTQCLMRDLENTHPENPGVFSEIVACLVELRDALHKSLLPGNGLIHKHILNNETPLLKEILTDSELR